MSCDGGGHCEMGWRRGGTERLYVFVERWTRVLA